MTSGASCRSNVPASMGRVAKIPQPPWPSRQQLMRSVENRPRVSAGESGGGASEEGMTLRSESESSGWAAVDGAGPTCLSFTRPDALSTPASLLDEGATTVACRPFSSGFDVPMIVTCTNGDGRNFSSANPIARQSRQTHMASWRWM